MKDWRAEASQSMCPSLHYEVDWDRQRLGLDFGVDVREAEAELSVVFARLLRRVLQRDDGRASSTDLRAGEYPRASLSELVAESTLILRVKAIVTNLFCTTRI